ncbi:MAG: DUF2333 family protein [Pseudomonadota bacterium]
MMMFWKKSQPEKPSKINSLVLIKTATAIFIVFLLGWSVITLLGPFEKSPITTPVPQLHEEAETSTSPQTPKSEASDKNTEKEQAKHQEDFGTIHPEPWVLPSQPKQNSTKIEHQVKGVATVSATIGVIEYEIHERFWGWRANDLIPFTDNVENYQLGVLDVVRRTSIMLAEKLSRFGGSDKFDHYLENAMNWFMIEPSKFWLPSAEDKYNEAIKEMHHYTERLKKGESRFYARADHLIPLLETYTDLLGSCHHHLIKEKEDDETPLRWRRIDNYFYFSKGVADSMRKILIAVKEDFRDELAAKGGTNLLDRAIISLGIAADLDPWIITNGDKDGFLANHRANMAAPISDARYILQVLQVTLAT